MKKILLFLVLTCIGTMTATAETTTTTTTQTTTTTTTTTAATTEMATTEAADETTISLKPDSAFMMLSPKEHWFYGYNFDIYYHQDTRNSQKNNGWSVSIMPEFGYKISQKAQVGLRLGGSYSSMRNLYTVTNIEGKEEQRDLRVRNGSWEVTPFGRYRLKTLFNDKVGVWLELHLYTGMEYPRVVNGNTSGTDYDGLRHSITYGAQLSPVITYQFNKKSTFQIFFSILSLGYSGSTFCYQNEERGRYREYSNDLIIFSGKLSNMLANQFTPGLYGLKFGVQKKF